MEWVERTDRTVEAAKDFLLDQLGVDEDEAEFEVLEEPKPGLFGRVRGQARVRARVAPRAPRSKDDRRKRTGRKADGGRGRNGTSRGDSAKGPDNTKRDTEAAKPRKPVADTPTPSTSGTDVEKERSPASGKPRPKPDAAGVDPAPFIAPLGAFLDELVMAFGLSGTTTVDVVDGELEARIDGDGLGGLIGPAGGVINAVQELSRTYLQKVAKGGAAPRLRVDIGGYRADRRAALAAFTKEVAGAVLDSGRDHAFEPMGSVDRKVIHDTASEIDGVSTRSEGEDPGRHVVITSA
ncbi:MAG: Jag N-terminal domain-containing protein [Microthrixaceae bacterium]|nr:Jag N-terminal domain-containing protein [Microthrixaceae bacterium]